MTEYKFLDSSIWLEYFHNRKYSNIIESKEVILLSILSIFEIKRKLIKEKYEKNKITRAIEFIKKRSLIIPINEEISEKAAEISAEKNLPAIDSLIYSSAILNNAKLFTQDNDFNGLKEVVLL
ncbi:MAG: PIN domain-containing protein [Nanoarchaeota archaeon]